MGWLQLGWRSLKLQGVRTVNFEKKIEVRSNLALASGAFSGRHRCGDDDLVHLYTQIILRCEPLQTSPGPAQVPHKHRITPIWRANDVDLIFRAVPQSRFMIR